MNPTAQRPLVAIYGPTASGKTALAIELAEKYNGEIVCADSRTIYKGLDIGTAKPTVDERRYVRHWGLDLVEPGEPYSAAEFKQYADAAIVDIRDRGKTPFLVGGTGLYMDSVVFNYTFGDKSDRELRNDLLSRSLEELHMYCEEHNIQLPENSYNKRYVVRAIERGGKNDNNIPKPIDNAILVGIETDRGELRRRIGDRAQHMFESPVVEEATKIAEKYGWDNEAMTGNIYRVIRGYINGEYDIAGAKERFETLDWHLAKRQLTWLKRNKRIQWYSLVRAREYLEACLAE